METTGWDVSTTRADGDDAVCAIRAELGSDVDAVSVDDPLGHTLDRKVPTGAEPEKAHHISGMSMTHGAVLDQVDAASHQRTTHTSSPMMMPMMQTNATSCQTTSRGVGRGAGLTISSSAACESFMTYILSR